MVSAVVRGSIYRTHVMPSADVMITRLRPNTKTGETSRAINDAMDTDNVDYNSGIRIGSTLQHSGLREEEEKKCDDVSMHCGVLFDLIGAWQTNGGHIPCLRICNVCEHYMEANWRPIEAGSINSRGARRAVNANITLTFSGACQYGRARRVLESRL